MSNYQYTFKFILIGDPGVGKSTLVQQYARGYCDAQEFLHYEPTIGVDLAIKDLYNTKWQKKIRLQLWDTAGHEKFRSITQNYYRRASCILMVYDICQPETWNSIKMDWYRQIRDHFDTLEEVPYMVVVGNKSDRHSGEKNKVNASLARLWANEHGLGFIEVSAKTGKNIISLFDRATEKVLERLTERQKLFEEPLVQLPSVIELSSCLQPSSRTRCYSWFCPRKK